MDAWLVNVKLFFFLFKKALFGLKLPTMATRVKVRRAKGAKDCCTNNNLPRLLGDDDVTSD